MNRKKILIIEDEAVVAQLVRLVIDKEAIDVFVATDGEQGIQKAKAEKPDLIFLDIMLPKTNGYEVIKALRRDPATAATPIVVISARAGEEGKKKILEAGCEDFIPKPFKIGQIKDAISRYLS
jgi:DNA-binding response OmpR family regulator